jgi:hypothetical protein
MKNKIKTSTDRAIINIIDVGFSPKPT